MKTPKPKKVTVKMTMEVREQIKRDRVHHILMANLPPTENVMDSYIYRVGLDVIDRANMPVSESTA